MLKKKYVVEDDSTDETMEFTSEIDAKEYIKNRLDEKPQVQFNIYAEITSLVPVGCGYVNEKTKDKEFITFN